MDDPLVGRLCFPRLSGLRVDAVVVGDEVVTVRVRSRARWARCTTCGVGSARVHSHYLRTLMDNAVGGRAVVVKVRVRRFRCTNAGCPQMTFVEQLDGLTFRYGRRSLRLQKVLQHLAVLLAGRAGARLAGTLATPVSRSTLLRLLRAVPDPAAVTPRVLGVDEFALRKGHVYGTVLVDIATRKVVDLLPDRQGATVARWLIDHPGVEVVCRDRCGAYAEAARLGAPAAIQVADRWHLWHNLAEAVEKTVVHHRALLSAACSERPEESAGIVLPEVVAGPRTCGKFAERTRARHTAVHALLAQGHGLRPIARELGLSRATVRRFAQAATAEELLVGRWMGRTSVLDELKPYLHQRWSQGCTNGSMLLAELREHGYQGGASTLRAYLQRLRTAFPPAGPAAKPPSVREVTGWLTRHPDRLDGDQAQQLKVLLARCPALAATAGHVHAFAELMHRREGHRLNQWIAAVRQDDLPGLRSFLGGIDQDHEAVVAGLSMPYNSGVVEGHNNKIKMLKRQMYGRAGFDLLRKRVLLTA